MNLKSAQPGVCGAESSVREVLAITIRNEAGSQTSQPLCWEHKSYWCVEGITGGAELQNFRGLSGLKQGALRQRILNYPDEGVSTDRVRNQKGQ